MTRGLFRRGCAYSGGGAEWPPPSRPPSSFYAWNTLRPLAQGCCQGPGGAGKLRGNGVEQLAAAPPGSRGGSKVRRDRRGADTAPPSHSFLSTLQARWSGGTRRIGGPFLRSRLQLPTQQVPPAGSTAARQPLRAPLSRSYKLQAAPSRRQTRPKQPPQRGRDPHLPAGGAPPLATRCPAAMAPRSEQRGRWPLLALLLVVPAALAGCPGAYFGE